MKYEAIVIEKIRGEVNAYISMTLASLKDAYTDVNY